MSSVETWAPQYPQMRFCARELVFDAQAEPEVREVLFCGVATGLDAFLQPTLRLDNFGVILPGFVTWGSDEGVQVR